ncbi:MAG: succinylglutamate desuccinylase/aspartoacylase family protein [Candidatus Woesebacteria bacterium]|nr:succinylglutamate desuccinylase/aspartoacylase family protein [Candidatus Woesebacteria bacterium]
MNKYKSYTIKKIPVIELPSSDVLSIWEHHFVANKPGKKIYLQANLHGPEVVGIGVLLKLIEIIKGKGLKEGEVKIVVSANPIGLNSKISGYQVGYKNLNSTKYANWNKIFKQKITDGSNYGIQVENKLAHVLQTISKGFDVVLDIHSAQNNIEVIYTFPNTVNLAKTLGIPHIILLNEIFSGHFDESVYFSSGKKSQILTVELKGGIFNEKYLDYWSKIIYKWMYGKNPTGKDISIWNYDFDLKYYTPTSGLVLPSKNPGDKFDKGDTLVEILKINGEKIPIKALSPGVIYWLPLVQSVGEGEEVIGVLQKGKV